MDQQLLLFLSQILRMESIFPSWCFVGNDLIEKAFKMHVHTVSSFPFRSIFEMLWTWRSAWRWTTRWDVFVSVGFLPALPVVDGVQDLSAYEMSDSGQLKLTEATWVTQSFQKGLDFRWTLFYWPGSKLEFCGWCPIKHGGQWKEMITRRSRSASLKVKINGFSLIRVW